MNEAISQFFGIYESMIRIFLACLLGGVVGFERKLRHKVAGARTHIIVALGAVIMTLVSIYGFANADTSRVAANIITGVSFLGAGLIFMRGGAVKGLTTAAGIWTMAGIGMAVGCGLYMESILCTVILAVIQILPSENRKQEVKEVKEIKNERGAESTAAAPKQEEENHD